MSLKVKSVIWLDGSLKDFSNLKDNQKKIIATKLNKQAMKALGYKEKGNVE